MPDTAENEEEYDMLQLALTIIIFLIIVIPVGRYMYHIATWKHTLGRPGV